MARTYFIAILAATLVVSALPAAEAGTISISNEHSGRYFTKGTSAGPWYLAGANYNSYFVFDLSGVTDAVTSAELDVYVETLLQGTGGTATLSDVSTDVLTLIAPGGNTGTDPGYVDDVHDDLETGMSYGTKPLDAADTVFRFTLNSAAIVDINAARGSQFAVGLSIDSGGIYGPTSLDTRNALILTSGTAVPLPAAAPAGLLTLAGLGLIALRRRSRSRGKLPSARV